jgi:hypothetical protein
VGEGYWSWSGEGMSDMTEEGGWTRGKIGKGRTMGKRRARNIKVEKKSKHSKQQHKRRDIFFFFAGKFLLLQPGFPFQ